MPKCKEHICTMQLDCAVVGCLLANPLIEDQSKEIQERLRLIDAPQNRIRYIIDLFQEKQPPKVNKTQINRYFLLRKHKGIDLDIDHVSKKEKEYHAGLKHNPTKRKIKIDYQKVQSRKKKHDAGLRTNNAFERMVEKKKFDETAAKQSAERMHYCPGRIVPATEYLQTQTPEQFDYAKRYGWMVAQSLTEPEPNFHTE